MHNKVDSYGAAGRTSDQPRLRPDWLDSVIGECQVIAGHCVGAERDQWLDILSTFAERLQPPTSALERLIVRGLLIDVAQRAAEVLHQNLHSGGTRSCLFSATPHLSRLSSSSQENPVGAFHSWGHALVQDLLATHPPTLGSSAGRVLRRDFHPRWTLDRLAKFLRSTGPEVRRSFRQEYGCSPADYQRSVRLAKALEQVLQDKVEPVAMRVGFRSKKNFYRAFRQFTGVTPAEYRQMSDDDRRAIEEAVRRHLSKKASCCRSPR